jgi:hypothetical protein
MEAQWPSGGVSHYMDVSARGGFVSPGFDATGEAIAMFILAQTVQERRGE